MKYNGAYRLFLIFFSCVWAFNSFAAEVKVFEQTKGVIFGEFPNAPHQIFIGINYLEVSSFENSYFRTFADFYTALTKKPFLTAQDRFLAVSKGANIISLPVEKVIRRELFLQPEYHMQMNPSFNLKLLQSSPNLVFKTTQDIYGLIELTTEMHLQFFDSEEIRTNQVLQKTILSNRSASQLPIAMTLRYSGDFNRALDHLITVSEFYPLNTHTTLVVTYLVIGIKKNLMSSGLGSGVFRGKMKTYIKETAVETLTNLNRLLGLN